MKLLLDENISYRIVKLLSEYFEEVIHINKLTNERLTDKEIWNEAKAKGYSILTYDADFSDLATYLGHPPKIIWLRFGNQKIEFLASRIIRNINKVKEFEKNPDLAVLEIY
ncbi:MAG: DUF5615 family PIN-like protein [Ignavibacteria bacterium]|jgi:predicted nuclease of predicted toxin-antitoxin system|nr:DUF5615 family PIN-like protein [Ignavibacteria bacterium]